MTEDVIVYAHPDGTTYVACLGEDREYWRWPAEQNGWQQRQRCPEALTAVLAESCFEYDSFQARLALRLSGALVP